MSDPNRFAGVLGVQQRVFPAYRARFFSRLAAACQGGFGLFAGLPRPHEGIASASPDALPPGLWRQADNVNLFSGRFYLCWQRGWQDWLDTLNPDVLIAEASPRWLSTPLMLRWMHRRGRPVIGWGLGAPGAANPVLRPAWLAFLRQFDALIAYSQRGREQYIACGIAPERVFVAANAVLPRPHWGVPTRSVAPKRLTVLFVGRLQQRKRVDLLIRACAALPSELQPRLWIVGDGPVRAGLEALASEVYPKTRFWGAVYGNALQPLWLQADLFVLPGTGGLALQEAMGYALPVIVAEGDGTQDDLVTPETGWQVPPGDLDALQQALLQALSDVPRLRMKGAAAYKRVARHVNLENMVAVFLQAIQSVAD